MQRNRGLRVTGFVGEQTARSMGIWGPTVPTHRPIEQRRIGTSVNGNSIWAFRYGTPGGTRVVAVGQIHGNEPGGAQIAAYLRVQRKPGASTSGSSTPSIPTDGAQRRTNVRGVDLNRNFNSGNWVYSGAGTGSYSGPSAASEPETRAMQGFLDSVRPRLMVVWHQVGRHVDDNRSVANYGLLRRYSTVTGYPIRSTPSCTTCGGTLTSYVNRRVSGATAFTVEMPTDFTYRTARSTRWRSSTSPVEPEHGRRPAGTRRCAALTVELSPWTYASVSVDPPASSRSSSPTAIVTLFVSRSTTR
ncbi:MAG: M14 family zinc carboxypeptidase [Ilumatobacteraceae bacterium]